MPAMTMHQAHVFLGEVPIELIQPAGGDDATYRDFCPGDGSLRRHQYGMWTDDEAEYDGLRARCWRCGTDTVSATSATGRSRQVHATVRLRAIESLLILP
jgi:hypothetical protein